MLFCSFISRHSKVRPRWAHLVHGIKVEHLTSPPSSHHDRYVPHIAFSFVSVKTTSHHIDNSWALDSSNRWPKLGSTANEHGRFKVQSDGQMEEWLIDSIGKNKSSVAWGVPRGRISRPHYMLHKSVLTTYEVFRPRNPSPKPDWILTLRVLFKSLLAPLPAFR